jgi:hypothetical protein
MLELEMTLLLTHDALWQKLWKAATFEFDPIKLHKRIEAAHAAIQQRMAELPRNHDGIAAEEQQAMADAVHSLRRLQKVQFAPSTQASKNNQPTAP